MSRPVFVGDGATFIEPGWLDFDIDLKKTNSFSFQESEMK